MRRPRLPRTLMAWVHVAAWLLAWAIVLAMVARVLSPAFVDMRMLGIHDWDPQEEFRYLVPKTIRRFHEFPFWNPYTCGGHPVWAGVESDSVIVSPFLPAYLWLPLAKALRVELVGSALLSAVGAWLFAGRYTRSPALRAFVVIVFAVNGRWTLQATSGHLWHYAWEWSPWTFFFLDRTYERALRGDHPIGDAVGAGASLALMVYMGGIYPLPQTGVAIGLYTIAYAAILRDTRPLAWGAAVAALAVVLSAPKLVPTLELFARYPRLTDSPEWMDLPLLWTILTSPDQDFGSHPAATSNWGWHEWGMYIGFFPAAILGVCLFIGRGERLNALRLATLVVFALGFGSFAKYAPWSLLHQVWIFRSQHVPSRWHYLALLLAAAGAVTLFERGFMRARGLRPVLEIVTLAGVAWVARDVANVARLPVVHMFTKPPPLATESVGPFRTEDHLPPDLGYPSGGEWAPPALPAALANIGTIDCGTFFPFHNYYRDVNNRAPGLGARAIGDPAYRGEAYVVEGSGKAVITRWTPNAVAVHVSGAHAGEHLALNQNYDPGWTANGRSTLDVADVPAATLDAGEEDVVFRYRPRTWWLGVGIFFLGLGGLVGVEWARRRGLFAEVPPSYAAPGLVPTESRRT